jgi:hypothetical protein
MLNTMTDLSAKLKPYLYRKRVGLREACVHAGVDFKDNINTGSLVECDHCGVWHNKTELHEDKGGMLICNTCAGWYGD